jgi:secreted trypsin-like serine protease
MKSLAEFLDTKANRRGILGAGLFASLSLRATDTVLAGKKHKKRKQRGKNVQGTIVGGKPVMQGDYPFVLAFVRKATPETVYDKQFCAGSLIDATHVLTAGHCTGKEIFQHPQRYAVVIGRWNLMDPTQGEIVEISAAAAYPGFNGSKGLNDAAVLTLGRPVDTTRYQPISLPEPEDKVFEQPGAMLTVAGWGSSVQQVPGVKRRPDFPPDMLEVDVPYVDDAITLAAYSQKKGGTPLNMATNFGAGIEGKDSCQGDSGGPIFAKRPDGSFVQIGIVSKGTGCGAAGFPGIYTRISNPEILAWITSYIAV